MLAAAKYIGTGVACYGLIGPNNYFHSSSIRMSDRNPLNNSPINTLDNLNNTTIKNEETIIPEIDRKKEFAELDRLLELNKNPSSNSLYENTGKEI
jgi:hypothetical protein